MRSQGGHYNLPRYIMIYLFMLVISIRFLMASCHCLFFVFFEPNRRCKAFPSKARRTLERDDTQRRNASSQGKLWDVMLSHKRNDTGGDFLVFLANPNHNLRILREVAKAITPYIHLL